MCENEKKGRFLRFLLLLQLSCTVLVTAFVIGFSVFALFFVKSDINDALFIRGDKTTRLYYYNKQGEALELEDDRISGYENMLFSPIGEVPNDLKNAFIAIEDKRFYEHGGVDWRRTASAAGRFVTSGGRGDFGGSTITQQLIKNLTGESQKSVTRKVGEVMRAAKLEKEFSKDEILEQYLNVVNLARGCLGVKTAANAYFSKEVGELSLAECATIAAITNNPAKYDPIKHPDENRVRRDIILDEMHAQGMIDDAAWQEAKSSATALRVNDRVMTGRINSWYADLVIEDVINALVKEKGYSKERASRLVYCGGLKIYTTIDPQIERVLLRFYENKENFPTHENGKKAQSAMMITDAKNGHILAVAGAIGTKNANRSQNYAFNTTRPSGSVIKPLAVYAPALEQGLITYGSVFDDVPISFRENGAPWPRNSPDLYRGLTTAGTALTYSINTVSVSILQRLGNASSFHFLKDKLGFSSLSEKGDMGAAALALGQQSNGVSLREVVGGYTALSSGGYFCGTKSFYKVLSEKNELLLSNEDKSERVFSAETAYITTMMLRRAVREGTGRDLTVDTKTDVAGKTGTSSKNCDKWFIGYTPQYLAGVWYGFDEPRSVADVRGNHALAIFDAVMGEILAERSDVQKSFPTNENVISVRYCKDSGKLLSQNCALDPRGDRSEIGYFKKGTEPTSYCDCHTLIDYCEGGGVACDKCPTECRHKVALLRVSRHFPRQIKVLDAPYSYGGECHEKKPFLTDNEPYYAQEGQTSSHYGIPMGVIPYNRICPQHTLDDFWDRRLLLP